MNEYKYDAEKRFVITDETATKTQYSFLQNNRLWEPSSIQYFYSLVERKHQNKDAVIKAIQIIKEELIYYKKML